MYSIYVVTNLVNDKRYVGQTQKPRARWSSHKSDARRKSPHPLHSAIRKYGEDSFSFDVLLEVETQEQADYQEQMWIILLGAHKSKHGYVVSLDGKGNSGWLPEDLNKRGRAVSKAFSEREGPHHSRKDHITADQVVSFYEEGKLAKEIASLLGCSIDTVSARLKEVGRPIKPGGRPTGYVYPSKPRKNMDEVKLLGMYASGYSTTRLSREFNCSTTLIRQRLIKTGITPRTNKESLEIRKSLPPVTWTRSEEANRKSSAALFKAWREGRHVGNTLAKKTPPDQLSE